MSDFCRQHGFYAPCPSCSGEEIIWEIPVVDCAGGGGVDMFRVNAGVYEDAMMVSEGAGPLASPPAPPISTGMPAATDHIPLRVNQPLYAKVKLLLQ